MKKEDLFKYMSELDDNLIAEAGEEGVEVKPIHIVESKKRFNIKPAAVTAACCVLLAGAVAAVGINYFQGGLDVLQPQNTGITADRTEPGSIEARYPEKAKYQYKGDYSEFKNFGGVMCVEFAEYYNTYRDILSASDVAVVGEFIDDPWQDIDPDDNSEIYPMNFNSYNCFKIDKILGGAGGGTVLEGGNIIISQNYAVKAGSFLSTSKLTPMLKGDRWVYFLKYNGESGVYYPLNDYMGRFPDPGYYRVYDHDPDLRDSANQFLPAMTNKYGLTDDNDFNENIFRTLTDIICHEYVPAVQCLYDSENLEMYNVTSFEMAEFESVVFTLRDGVLYVDESWSSVSRDGIAVTGENDVLHKIFITDLNGDGNGEICLQIRSSEEKFGEYILILDYANYKFYAVAGKTGESEYYLGELDGELIAYNTKHTLDGSRGDVISDEKLSLDMNDCFLHLNASGHSEYCLQDAAYCEQQEGECPYRHDDHHAEEHSGHSEYCLQDAAYCEQQEGECPYRQDDHHDDELCIGIEKRGHYEYCLQNADYCAQQEGECPYRQNGHHSEENSTEHHGHSEYCLQDAAYCEQQEGECPYRQDSHHGEAHHGDSHH